MVTRRRKTDGAGEYGLDLAGAADPDAVRTALRDNAEQVAQAGHGHGHPALGSVRQAVHRGHTIQVRTTYEITVDDEPFDAAVSVDNAGRVHYHGLPTRDFASVITLVEKAIDLFPDDFTDHPAHNHTHSGQSPDHGDGDGDGDGQMDPNGHHRHGGHAGHVGGQ